MPGITRIALQTNCTVGIQENLFFIPLNTTINEISYDLKGTEEEFHLYMDTVRLHLGINASREDFRKFFP